MKLSVIERVMTLDLLPREGDFLTLKILRELKEQLVPTPKEVKKFGITATRSDDGMITYSWEKNVEVDIPLDEPKIVLIREQLKIIDRNKHLTEQQMSLYEKFVIAKEEEDKKLK